MDDKHRQRIYVGVKVLVKKYFSISTHEDSDMGFGAGITITY